MTKRIKKQIEYALKNNHGGTLERFDRLTVKKIKDRLERKNESK